MLHVVLVEPEIPQNCGNISRTCAAAGASLHLVRPLGFDISQDAIRRNMKRCGLDYWHLVEITDYESLDDLFLRRPEAAQDLWLATTKAPRPYTEARFSKDSWLFFGKETAGLPLSFRERFRNAVRPPAHGQRGQEPEPQQRRGRLCLRGSAPDRVSRPAGPGRDGRHRLNRRTRAANYSFLEEF